MGLYKVVFSRRVQKDFRKIPKNDGRMILGVIEELGRDPRSPNSRKLTGVELYRIRIGVYRVVYEIHDDELVVMVVKASQRKNISRK